MVEVAGTGSGVVIAKGGSHQVRSTWDLEGLPGVPKLGLTHLARGGFLRGPVQPTGSLVPFRFRMPFGVRKGLVGIWGNPAKVTGKNGSGGFLTLGLRS